MAKSRPTLLFVLLPAAAVALLILLSSWVRDRRDHAHDAAILAAAGRYGVDPALVKAVVWQESRFDSQARGGHGEIGLMQITELAATEYAVDEKLVSFQHEELFDPAKNTQAGTWYLGKLLRRYAHTDNPVPYALADYNAGRRNVLRWLKGEAATRSERFIEQIDFPTTRQYVRSVMQRYHHYANQDPTRSHRPAAGQVSRPP